MTSPAYLGPVLALLVGLLWIFLVLIRGGTSSGLSKRALAFGLLVYGEILLGATAAHFSQVHSVGAIAVALAATWVWCKARTMQGNARISANLILLLTLFVLTLGLSAVIELVPWMSALHGVAAAALLGAATWHAYEMRIYPVNIASASAGSR